MVEMCKIMHHVMRGNRENISPSHNCRTQHDPMTFIGSGWKLQGRQNEGLLHAIYI